MTPEQLREEATAIDRMHGETLTVEWRLRMAEQLRAHAAALEEARKDAERLDHLMRHITGRALRECIGELADTSDLSEFRAAIDAARGSKP